MIELYHLDSVAASELTPTESPEAVAGMVTYLEHQGAAGLLPVVAVRQGQQRLVIDGNTRTIAAQRLGLKVPSVEMPAEDFDKLKAAGFSEIEIAYAALLKASESDAADQLVRDWPGIDLDKRGYEAFNLIELPDNPGTSRHSILFDRMFRKWRVKS